MTADTKCECVVLHATPVRWRPALLLVLLSVLASAPASAAYLRDKFSTGPNAETLLEEARAARWRSELALASSLLDQAEALSDERNPGIVHERALLLRDGGDPETSVTLLEEAARLNPSNTARVDLAAVLVELGRWPEAVVVLRSAFDERGGSLKAADLEADPRFASLARFAPFTDLMDTVNEEQQGLIGRLQGRLESIEASARRLQRAVDALSAALELSLTLLRAPWTAVVVLLLLVFVIAAGLGQLSILPPPWTIVASFFVSSAIWSAGAMVVSQGDDEGWAPITIVAVLLGIPVVARLVSQWWDSRRTIVLPASVVHSDEELEAAPTLPEVDTSQILPMHHEPTIEVDAQDLVP